MARDAETGLTEKQVRFCQEYLIDLNATQAAIRAGYSEDTAYSIGHENLSKPELVKIIDRMKRDRALRCQIDADKVLAEISRLAFSDIRDIFTEADLLRRVSTLSDDAAAAVQSVKVTQRRVAGTFGDDAEYEDVVEIKLADKKGPLEMLAKHLGELTDSLRHSGEVDNNIKVTFHGAGAAEDK